MTIATRKFSAGILLLLPGLLLSLLGIICLSQPTTVQVEWIDIGSLGQFPPDGKPRLKTVLQNHHDAWATLDPRPVGTVFVRRTAADHLYVLRAIDTRYGDAIRYVDELHQYQSICYRVNFDLSGKILPDDRKPVQPPLEMNSLDTRIAADHLWIKWKMD